MVSTQELARDEREDFADFLEGLTPEQWEVPTLCAGGAFARSPHTVSFEELSTIGIGRAGS